MEKIEVYVNNSKEYLNIESYDLLVKPDSLLFFKESSLLLDNNDSVLTYEIFKIQFIASCKTKFKDEILVAFYIGEYGELSGYIISPLPENLIQSNNKGTLIDYKAYSDICVLTGETKMSLAEYYKSVMDGCLDLNSYMNYKDMYLNRDQSKDIC